MSDLDLNNENRSNPNFSISNANISPENMEKLSLDKALGCVFGAFVGDSLGSVLEFKKSISRSQLQNALTMDLPGVFGNAPGQVTDDSELAMCLLTGLSETSPTFSLNNIAKYYKLWVESSPFDIGNTTRASIGQLYNVKTKNYAEIASKSAMANNQRSQSNGSFMRCSPLAVFGRRLGTEDFVAMVQSDVGLTHSNEVIKQAQSYYLLYMAHLIQNPEDREGAEQVTQQYLARCCEEVKQWVSDSKGDRPEPGNPNMGYAKIAFDHTFREISRPNVVYEEAIARVLSLGGDTDTNACIVGAMIGAFVGYSRINPKWLTTVQNYDGTTGIPRNREFLDQTKVYQKVIRIFETAPERLDINHGDFLNL